MSLDRYEQQLLDGWEDVFKKGQLTLWIMLALKDGPKHMAEIKQFITDITNSTVQADDKSMYRALRRYYDAEMVEFSLKPGENGPELKIYRLSAIGAKILDTFVARNITGVLLKPTVMKLLKQRSGK